jgi:hypothetical protein
MEPISDIRLRRLMIALHKAIAESSDDCVAHLASSDLDGFLAYPPGESLEADELAAVMSFLLSEPALRGLRKLIADATSAAFFRFFNIMDATGDPEDGAEETWLGVELAEPTLEYREMLHDKFFETYWDYAE